MNSVRNAPFLRLNRFTTLPFLLDILKTRRLVLLSPDRWPDKNDSGILAVYKKRKQVKRLAALCFTHGQETLHQWNTYSAGSSGCCIQFRAEELCKAFDSNSLLHGPIIYKKIKELTHDNLDLDQIPFTKRWPYRCEEEYRVICEDNDSSCTFDVAIDLSVITKITLNQAMPAPVYATIKNIILESWPFLSKQVNHSTLTENVTWLNKYTNS